MALHTDCAQQGDPPSGVFGLPYVCILSDTSLPKDGFRPLIVAMTETCAWCCLGQQRLTDADITLDVRFLLRSLPVRKFRGEKNPSAVTRHFHGPVTTSGLWRLKRSRARGAGRGAAEPWMAMVSAYILDPCGHVCPYVCGFYWTVLRHWSQLVPNMSNDIWGH